MRPIRFLGSSLDDLRQFPVDARQEAGYQFVLHCFQKKEGADQPEGHQLGQDAIQGFDEGTDMKNQDFPNVWDAIEDTPQQTASLRARAALMMELERMIQTRGLTQAAAAKLFGVTQPRISDLTRGKINLFSLDTLLDMATTAGLNPVIKVTPPKRKRAREAVAA